VETKIPNGESAMSYWDSKVFSRIYRKWQKRISRHPDHYFGRPIEMARKEFFALKDRVADKGKPLNMQPQKEVYHEVTEPAPVDEDPIIHVGGMAMHQCMHVMNVASQRKYHSSQTM